MNVCVPFYFQRTRTMMAMTEYEIFDEKQWLLFYTKPCEMLPNKGVFYSKKGFTFFK